MAVDIDKLEDSPHLLDLLIQMEDVLDSLDIYVFANWFDGEVVEGPKVRRYWLDMTLKYPYEKMPDPKAALRLLKHGVRVDYQKVSEKDPSKQAKEEKAEDSNEGKVWLIKVSIPRRLIVDINAAELDYYDEEVDIDDVQDAEDSGMTAETGYVDSEEGSQEEGGNA